MDANQEAEPSDVSPQPEVDSAAGEAGGHSPNEAGASAPAPASRLYWLSIVSGLIAIGLGVLAYQLFPSASPISLPAGFQVLFDGSTDASLQFMAATVAVQPGLPSDSRLITVSADVYSMDRPPSTTYVSTSVILPPGVTPPPCHRSMTCTVFKGQYGGYSVVLQTNTFHKVATYPIWQADMTFTSPGGKLAFDSDGLNAQAVLPEVSLPPLLTAQDALGLSSPPAGQMPPITVDYQIPGGPYDWTSGPQPSSNGLQTQWQVTEAAASSYQQVVGINNATQEANSNSLFIAGALAGTAVTLGVGALLELIRVRLSS